MAHPASAVALTACGFPTRCALRINYRKLLLVVLRAMNFTLEQYERLNPRCEIIHKGTPMTFVTPSQMTKWRVETIFTKEPCTLEWIETFSADDVLFDIGANVGTYSIWAAAT